MGTEYTTTDDGVQIYGDTTEYDPSTDPLTHQHSGDASDQAAAFGGEIWHGAEHEGSALHNLGDAAGDLAYGAFSGDANADYYYHAAAEEADAGLTQAVDGASEVYHGVEGVVENTAGKLKHLVDEF